MLKGGKEARSHDPPKVLSHEDVEAWSSDGPVVLSLEDGVVSCEDLKVFSHGDELTCSPDVREAQWLLHVLLRQANMEERAQWCVEEMERVPRGVVMTMPTPTKVQCLLCNAFVVPRDRNLSTGREEVF